MAAKVEIKNRKRTLERFDSNVDPQDADECIALLHSRARELREKPAELSLYAYNPRDVRKSGTYKV